MTTQVLYQSDKVKINFENDCYSIIATDDLKVGELILLEIVIWSPKLKHIIASVMYDRELSKELYPRDTDDPGKKVNTNVFRFDENYVLGKVFSKFNHSCIPNCHMDAADFVNNERVYGMWTHRTVKKGEELTIDYVQTHDVSYHDEMKAQHGFTCSCTDDFILQNKKRVQVHVNLGRTFRDKCRNYTAKLMDNFMNSKHGLKYMKNKKAVEKLAKKIKLVT